MSIQVKPIRIKDQKHVIFFCDECDLLKETIALFRQLHPLVDVITFSDRLSLIGHVRNKPPELIVVYLTQPDSEYISFVKEIRENINSALIPVRIYHTLPDEEELKMVLKR